ncbi:MAG: hypothetical protein ACPG8K_04365 [Crocinitomicaceae bacterium]
MKNIFLLVSAVIILMACKSGLEVVEVAELPQETNEMPKIPVAEGKVVLMTKCARCHDLPDVDSYSKEKWDKVLPPMILKANLSEDEANNVTAYVYWELEN